MKFINLLSQSHLRMMMIIRGKQILLNMQCVWLFTRHSRVHQITSHSDDETSVVEPVSSTAQPTQRPPPPLHHQIMKIDSIIIFLMVIALVIKLLSNCDGDEPETEGARASENSRLLLLPKHKVYSSAYGTNGKDLESGSGSSSEDDLYDAKICVICYDNLRNCFFFPCGHCVTCHTCARRIMKEENKTCPICRGYIDKVRKLRIV